MENIDLIILTIVVSLSFLIFIIITAKEFNKMNQNEFNEERNQGAEKFLNKMGSPYDTDFDRNKSK